MNLAGKLPVLVWDGPDGPCKRATNAPLPSWEHHDNQGQCHDYVPKHWVGIPCHHPLQYQKNSKTLEKNILKKQLHISANVWNEGFSDSVKHAGLCNTELLALPKWTALEAGHVCVITAMDLLNTGSQEIPTTTPKAMITSLPALWRKSDVAE